MKYLICLALVGLAASASLPATNYIQDTADVAAAKARFFQLYREQAALAEAAPDHDANNQQDFTAQSTFSSGSILPSQHQFAEVPVTVNSEGFVQNTAEVQNAINEFNTVYQAQLAATRSPQSQAFQQQAPVTVNSEGFVQNTADVQYAINEFNAAYQAQLTATRAIQGESIQHQASGLRAAPSATRTSQSIQQEVPVIVNSEGFVQNTADVQDAINVFNAAYQAQLAATRSIQAESIQHQASGLRAAPEHHTAPVNQQASFRHQYSGPYATFNADGSVQNTAEVQATASVFFDTYQQQLAATAAAQSLSNNVQSHSIPQQFAAEPINQVVAVDQRWTGPVASTIPAGVEGASAVVDTAEVQAAEAEFLRAYKAQLTATGSFQAQASPNVYQAANSQPISPSVYQASQNQLALPQTPVFRAAAVHNQQRPTSFQASPTVYRGQNDIADPAAARSAHHEAFMQAIQTTGDTSPEGQAAKTKLFNAYQNILNLIS